MNAHPNARSAGMLLVMIILALLVGPVFADTSSAPLDRPADGAGHTPSVSALPKASVGGVPNTTAAARATAALSTTVYLPLIFGTGVAPAFAPTANTQLNGGNYAFSSVTIPAGVTVTLLGGATISVAGDTVIAGTLTGDCTAIEIRGAGALTLDGLIRNTCSQPPQSRPEIKLVVDGTVMVGSTPSNEDAIVSVGSVFIVDSATEHLSLAALAVGPGRAGLPRSASAAAPAQAGGGGAVVARPVRAGPGADIRITADGPVNIAGNLTAQNGANAPAKIQPGVCDNTLAMGGTGGSISLAARGSILTIANNTTLRAGDGGKGGDCTAPAGDPASAAAGPGGLGGGVYVGGQTVTFGMNVTLYRGNGGPGGDATATGSPGPACAKGGDAIANGGRGGDRGGIGYIITLPGMINGAPREDGASGGTGGAATATGGKGGDCAVCPAGKGGDGGNATATGGQGGNGATGRIWPIVPGSHRKGNGGAATAIGGKGGNGASCCNPPMPGGNGGKGGNASATGGAVSKEGTNPGVPGAVGGKAGDGGDGGVGNPPGKGGAGGIGVNVPNGLPGKDGSGCPNLGIISSFKASDAGVITITIAVSGTLDGAIYDLELFFGEQQPQWQAAQLLRLPPGWTLKQLDGGIGFVTAGNPLRAGQPIQIVIWAIPPFPGNTIVIHMTDRNHNDIGTFISRREGG